MEQAGLEYRVLGPLQVLRHGEPVALEAPRRRALLALFLIHANEPLSTDRIIDEIWGNDPPGGGVKTLQVHVANLRKVLEPGRRKGEAALTLVTEHGGYSLRVASEAIDAGRLEKAVDAARGLMPGEPERTADVLARALEEWRGRPYEDFAYERFAQTEIKRLDELRMIAIEDRIEADLALGRHRRLVGELEQLTGQHPLRERLWAHLMMAHYRSGRQGEALRAYQRARANLTELGIEPTPGLRRLEEEILLQDPSLDLETERKRHNLPARIGTLLGRADEIDELGEHLADARQVTLTGPGGVGKTSLAVEVARRLVPMYRDGVWLVDLAPIRSGELVTNAIAEALGVSDVSGPDALQSLASRLRAQQLLLLLDNCEHLVQACAELTHALLRASPSTAVLATSRQPLRIPGETVRRIRPLPVPVDNRHDWTANEARQFASVRLFESSAAATGGGFVVTDTNASLVVDICRRLDGIPLALELAAAQTDYLGIGDLAAHLGDDRMPIGEPSRVRPARQRTLDDTIQWSYNLLSPEEQQLFERLSVFEGEFDLDAVEAVSSDARTVDVMGRLVASSMVGTTVPSGSSVHRRFRLLETLRSFGRDHLEKRGEAVGTARLHMAHYRDLVEQAAEATEPGARAGWVDRLHLEYSNVRAAVDFSFEHEPASETARFASGLSVLWMRRLHSAEGWLVLKRMLDDLESLPDAARLEVLVAAAFVSWGTGSYAAGERMCDEAIALARMLDNRSRLSDALWARGRLRLAKGDGRATTDLTESADLSTEVGDPLRRARALMLVPATGPDAVASLQECVTVFREHDDAYMEGAALVMLGRAILDEGDLEEAGRITAEAVSLESYVGARKELPYGLYQLCVIHRLRGEFSQAAAFGSLAVEVAAAFDVVLLASKGLMHLGAVAVEVGLLEDAARLFGASSNLRRRIGAPEISTWERTIGIERVIADLRDALGEQRFAAATKESSAWALDEAVAFSSVFSARLGADPDPAPA